MDKGLTYGSWLTDRCNVAGSIRTFLRLGCSALVADVGGIKTQRRQRMRLGRGDRAVATASGTSRKRWQEARRGRENKRVLELATSTVDWPMT